jgi:CheY-like chemotaxis protein
MMPEMDGIETVHRIRSLETEFPYLKELPIIALTANAVFGTEEMFISEGFDGFLTKPIITSDLNAILAKWIPKNKRQHAAKPSEPSQMNIDVGFAIEGLNTQQGLMLSGGTRANYLKTLTVFHKDGCEKSTLLRQCLVTNDLPLYTIHVHALASACANVGAEKLSKAARYFELAGKEGDMSFVQTYNERLLTDLKTLLDKITTVLTKTAEESRGNFVSIEFLQTELTLLKTALNDFDSTTIQKITDDLAKTTQSPEVAPAIADILKNILIGDFDKTLTLIDSLLSGDDRDSLAQPGTL